MRCPSGTANIEPFDGGRQHRAVLSAEAVTSRSQLKRSMVEAIDLVISPLLFLAAQNGAVVFGGERGSARPGEADATWP